MVNVLTLTSNLYNHISFVPHGECWLWDWRMILLQGGSDFLIAFAYYVISVLLVYILYKTRKNPYIRSKALFLYALFIFSCGTTHVIDIVLVYRPLYWTSGLVKLLTGIVSILAMLETIKVLKETIKDINKYYSVVKPRIDNVLSKPSLHDSGIRDKFI